MVLFAAIPGLQFGCRQSETSQMASLDVSAPQCQAACSAVQKAVVPTSQQALDTIDDDQDGPCRLAPYRGARHRLRAWAAAATQSGPPPSLRVEPKLRTRLTELLGIETPVMLAGMGGIANRELVGAVSRAGGFGTWGSAVEVFKQDPEYLRAEMQELGRACGGRPFGVDLLVHGHDGSMMDVLLDIFTQGGAKAFISGRGHLNAETIGLMHNRGMLVGMIAGKVQHALSAVASGVDFVIAQGAEGGGHTGEIPLSVLLPQVVDAVGAKVPVVAAGGLYDGRGLAAALAYGADGVWLGTRFLMSKESYAHPVYKQRLMDATVEDTRVTRAFSGSPLRSLRTKFSDAYEAQPKATVATGAAQLINANKAGVWRHYALSELMQADGSYKVDFDANDQAYPTGMVAGLIDKIDSAEDIVKRITSEALVAIDKSSRSRL